jgi:hypothetical protein
LKIIRSLATGKRFVGCSNYFTDVKCNATYPLPQKHKLDLSAENCKEDNFPQVRVYAPKSQFNWCLNPDCKLMQKQFKEWSLQKEKQKEKELAKEKIEKNKTGKKRSKQRTSKKKPSKASAKRRS